MDSDDIRRRARSLRDHIPARRRANPPVETGERIGTVERTADEQVRVTWCEYQGKPYVNVRLWKRNSTDGSWWPDAKKGISIRIRELPDFADAIGACIDKAVGTIDGTAPASGEQRGRRYDPGDRPPSGEGRGGEFDEFSPGR